MRGNIIGKMISMISFGESHGKAMGVVLDGIPSNLPISIEELKKWLERRMPGRLVGTSERKEPDVPEILSGIYEEKTLGTPIAVIIKNVDHNSKDYLDMKNVFRKGHADKTTLLKYKIRDHRGGGRSSGRETVSRVIAGYFSSLILSKISFEIGPVIIGEKKIDNYSQGSDEVNEALKYLAGLKKDGESVGGQVTLKIKDVPDSLGEPVFDKLKADISKALLSIGGVISCHFGDLNITNLKGSEITSSPLNFFGGIEGGISNGDELIITIGVKPTSTIGEKAKKGRHDPCIIPRMIVVAESMILFTLADHYLRQKTYENN